MISSVTDNLYSISSPTPLSNITSFVTTSLSKSRSVTEGDVFNEGPIPSYILTVIVFLYAVVFVLGLGGNALVVYVVASRRRMRSTRNLFIANLAVADVTMCLLSVPFTPLSAIVKSWPFGDSLCHVVPMTLGVTVHVSTLTSAAVAVDRYLVIVRPFQPRLSQGGCLVLVAVIWIVSMTVSTPLAVFQKVKWSSRHEAFVCTEVWPSMLSRQFFTAASLVLQYIIPGAVITYCYKQVSVALSVAALYRPSFSSRSRQQIKRKQKTNRMLFAVATIFVGCWLPLNIIHVIQDYKSEVTRWNDFVLLFFAAHLIAMSSTVYNPFVYAWLNDTFRHHFRSVAAHCCRCSCCRSSGGNFNSSNRAVLLKPASTLCCCCCCGRAAPNVDSDTNHASVRQRHRRRGNAADCSPSRFATLCNGTVLLGNLHDRESQAAAVDADRLASEGVADITTPGNLQPGNALVVEEDARSYRAGGGTWTNRSQWRPRSKNATANSTSKLGEIPLAR